MKILLTNDDGYSSFGIQLLYKLLSKDHQVVIVAPSKPQSAKSIAITIHRPSEVNKIDDHTFSIDGTPADSVAFGLSSLDTKFDLVISGCNHGLNVSYDTMYSGTIGATLQALTYEIPAIAISCNNNFDIVEKYFLEVFDYVIEHNMLDKEKAININFPVGNIVKEIKETHIYYRKKKEATYYLKVEDNKYQALRDIDDKDCLDKDSDVYAVHHDIVSITRLNKAFDR